MVPRWLANHHHTTCTRLQFFAAQAPEAAAVVLAPNTDADVLEFS